MDWTILGSGTIFPHPSRASAAHLLRHDGHSAIFDCGSGTKDRLARARIAFGSISHVVCSHAHLDHWADLLALLFYRAHAPPLDRSDALTIVGPPGFSGLVQAVAHAADPALIAANSGLKWFDLAPLQPLECGWFELTAFQASHASMPASVMRVELDGSSIAYSGDSGPCPGLVQAAKSADCLVCECSLPASLCNNHHMSPAGVRRLCDEAKPKLAVLTHLFPQVLEIGLPGADFDGYAGDVVVGGDGLRVDVDAVSKGVHSPDCLSDAFAGPSFGAEHDRVGDGYDAAWSGKRHP